MAKRIGQKDKQWSTHHSTCDPVYFTALCDKVCQ